MNDQEIARYFMRQLKFRLSGPDMSLVESVADSAHLNVLGTDWECRENRRKFEHLKTVFAAELAHAGKVVTP